MNRKLWALVFFLLMGGLFLFAAALHAQITATCVISGTVTDIGGTPVPNAVVRMRTVSPTMVGNAGLATNDLTTRTASDGTWSLTVAQGLNAQIDIPVVGIAKDTIVPLTTTATFSSLTLYNRGTLTPATILSTAGPSLGGDLTGSSPNPRVVGFRGYSLVAGTPTHGQAWVYNNSDGAYRLTNINSSSSVGTVTSVGVSGGTTGLTVSGSPVSSSGTMTLGGTLAAASGGTGQASYVAGDILYASGTTALSRLGIGGNGTCLSVSGGALAWGACGSGGGGYATIQEEGAGLTQRTTLNFIGAALTAVDNSGSSRTDVTLSQSPASASVVGTGRSVSTSAPLGGGGDLSADRTVTCTTCVTSAASLAANQLALGAGGQAAATLGSLGTSTQVLHGNAAGAPTWSAVALGTDVSGQLPVGNGGTGAATAAAGFDALAPTTTRGDLIARGASSNGRLAIGLSGRYLRSDGTDPSWSAIQVADVPTLNQSTTGNAATATALATDPTDCSANQFANAINAGGNLTCAGLVLAGAQFANQGATTTVLHGNAAGNPSFSAVSLTADVSGILPGANGGTGNGFTAFSGPATSLKTFTLPNADATILTTNAVVTVAQGGSGAATLTGLLQGNGTGAFTTITNSSTVGQTLRVTGASTYGWGALDLADADAVTGALPAGNLGAHASTHKNAGSDEIATATAGANAIPKAEAGGTLAAGWLPVMVGDSGAGGVKGAVPAPATGDATKCLRGDGTWGACGAGSVTGSGFAGRTAVWTSASDLTYGTISDDGTTARFENRVASTATNVSIGTDQDPYTPPGELVWVTATASFVLKGLADGSDGRRLTIANKGASNTITVTHEGATTAANSIRTPSGVDLTLAPGLAATFVYDIASSRWRITSTTRVDLAGSQVTGVLPAANYATMIGDSGAGGTKGAVPAPAAGDAAANKFLKADGTWEAAGLSGGAANRFTLWSGATTVTYSDAYQYSTANDSVPTFLLVNPFAAKVPLVVKGAATQTANLQEWKNSSGTVLARVTSVGVLASPHATFSTSEVFGIGATATNGAGVAIGRATSVGDSSVAVGYNAICGGAWSVAIGASAQCQDRTVAVGKGAVPTASNQIVIGTTPNGAMTQYPAAVIASTTYSHTLNGMGGSGTNIAGGAELVAGGKGTGNAAGGATGFQSSYPGASGTTLQTLTDRVAIPSKWTTLTESTDTAIATLTYSASTAVGAEFVVTVEARDASNGQAMTYRVAVNSNRDAAGNTASVPAIIGTPPVAAGTGTLTCSFTMTEGASAATLNANCVSSLTQTTLRATWQAQANGAVTLTQP